MMATTMTTTNPWRRGVLAAALGACLAPSLHAQAAPARGAALLVRAENPLGMRRAEETIEVPWSTVRARLPQAAAGRVRVTLVGADREIVSQAIDDDGDGTPELLIFQSNFGAGEAKTFAIEAAAPARAESKVHARHDVPRDDIAWESDRIAFRMYGEGLKKTPSAMSSSGIDVWLKRVRTPIVEKWYAKGHDAYHVDTGEGADFYDVGQTLGTGGTAIWRNDSLYRADNFKAWRIIANGPVRTTFELRYDPWDAAGTRVSEVKRISIDAGHNLFRQVSTFTAPAGTERLPYAVGLVKRPGMVGTTSRARAWAWLTGWGPVARKNGGHGDLGTAVLVERARLTDWKETGDHYLAIGTVRPGEPLTHWVGAGWTASGDFPDVQAWWRHLDELAQRLDAPMKVTYPGAPTPATGAR
jgi:pectinesterase